MDKDTKPKKDENLCKLKYNRLNKKYVWINTNKRWWNVNLILSRKISPNNGTQHYTKGEKILEMNTMLEKQIEDQKRTNQNPEC